MFNNEAVIANAKTMWQAAELINAELEGSSTPGPLVYDLAGFAGTTFDEFTKMFAILATGLEKSLHDYEVYDDNRHPTETVNMAAFGLGQAIGHIKEASAAIGRVQAAVNGQSYTAMRATTTAPIHSVAVPSIGMLVCAACRHELVQVCRDDGHPVGWICPNACTKPEGAA